MPNSYFQFKQFTVQQDRCAMKVCTDACLFGALAAEDKLQFSTCLDIGTGTGLLSLMLAQKNSGITIDAVEIDAEASRQAKENFDSSPWSSRLTVFNTDVLNFHSGKKYECIISNPPFFENDLWSPDTEKNKAKHDAGFNLLQLLEIVSRYLKAAGTFAVLLPHHRIYYFKKLAAGQGLHVNKQILVRQTVNHDPFRGILFFGLKKTNTVFSDMSIKDAEGNYTGDFIAALKDYYLHL